MMKLYLLLMVILIAIPVCASDIESKKIIGKPGVPASFADRDIIQLAIGESRRVDLAVHYFADAISYELQTTDGLDLVDLKQSYIRDDVTPNTLIIPVEIKVNRSGRYYLHVRIFTSTDNEKMQGVLSKIISSESPINEVVQKKSAIPNKFKILPVVETIKDANDE
jgi:hypothetical protein